MARLEVLIPSHNHALFVEQCLQSVFEQSRPPDRLLVIDDGSSDGSPDIIARTLTRCPFPSELIVRPNKGLCATLNEGLAATRGDYFAYVGSDDLLHPRRLELGAAALDRKADAVLSYSNVFVIDEENRILSDSADWNECEDGDLLESLLHGRSIPQSTTVTYRRSPLERIGWNEQSRLEDYELFLRLARLGPFAFIPQTLGYWRQHGLNVSKQVDMMLEAMEDAQLRVAADLGIGPKARAAYRGALRFRHANYMLRSGNRLEAARLTLANLRHAQSPAAAARQLARLLLPLKALEYRETLLARRREQDRKSAAGAAGS
jgi:alpha-1,3-rhamnosyltransferase